MQFCRQENDGGCKRVGSFGTGEESAESVSLTPTSLSEVSHQVPSEFLNSIAVLFLLPCSTNSPVPFGGPFTSPNSSEDGLNNVNVFADTAFDFFTRTQIRIAE